MSSRVHARARSHTDRSGDPLDGLVNLFDLGLVLAVGLLLAALSSLHVSGLTGKSSGSGASSSNPVVITHGTKPKLLRPTNQKVSGRGTPLGTVYRLDDGSLVYVTGKK